MLLGFFPIIWLVLLLPFLGNRNFPFSGFLNRHKGQTFMVIGLLALINGLACDVPFKYAWTSLAVILVGLVYWACEKGRLSK